LTADIKALIGATTSYLKKNTESKSGWETFTDRTDKVIAILSALVALIVSIMAFFKKGFMTKYKAIIAAVAVLSFAALMAFLLAGFLQTVIFAALVIALIIFLFLLLALKCIEFLDRKGYKVVDSLLASFDMEVPKQDRSFIETMQGWLNGVIFQQILAEAYDITLEGSFIRGFDNTEFKIIPSETEEPDFKVIENKLVIPVNIEVYFTRTGSDERLLLKNVQYNQLVITEDMGKKLTCKTYYGEGLVLLGNALAKWVTETHSKRLQDTRASQQ